MQENKKEYYIRVKGQRITVPEETFREIRKMNRRERYLEERDKAYLRVLYSDLDTDERLGDEIISDICVESVEQMIINKIMVENLTKCLESLSDAEREIIEALYYTGMTERRYSEESKIPQQTINSQKLKIISKLKKLLECKK